MGIFLPAPGGEVCPPTQPWPVLACGIPPRTEIGLVSDQRALMRAARRDNLRDTVFLWRTPLVIARCSSGCAKRRAEVAVSLSPVAIAASTFLTKVRTRLTRARLMAVRLAVCRIRFSADLWLAIQLAVKQRTPLILGPGRRGQHMRALLVHRSALIAGHNRHPGGVAPRATLAHRRTPTAEAPGLRPGCWRA